MFAIYRRFCAAINIPTPENGAREEEATEEATEETLRDDIDDETWVAVLETAEHAAQRWPDNARIARAKALACATLGLRLAAADALATLDAMDDARLYDIVEAGAAIEGRALDDEAMNDAIDAIRKHGVSIPENARTSEATAAACRRIEDTDIARESAAAWGEMARSAQRHHAQALMWQCRRRVLRHPEPDLRELVDIASEGLDGEGIDVAAPALESAVRACAGSRRNIRRIGALRCEQLALNADIEGYLAQMGEDDEQSDAVEGDAQESRAMCRKWWLEQLAAALGCSPNEAQGRFDAWKKGTKKATRKLRASPRPRDEPCPARATRSHPMTGGRGQRTARPERSPCIRSDATSIGEGGNPPASPDWHAWPPRSSGPNSAGRRSTQPEWNRQTARAPVAATRNGGACEGGELRLRGLGVFVACGCP